ncbi:MAG TPA: tyrosine-protein phosphatase [Opitutaceae bacterium]|nr:tyrosine-protein phosphatase [Opitutaceae bacterium]
MSKPLLFVFALAVALADCAAAAPRARPPHWAEPLIDTSLDNAYRVSPELYRCEQPTTANLADLQALGIRSVLNLRKHHRDPETFAAAGLQLLAEPMNAGEVTEELLVAALRQFRDAPKPVAVHCWHGSDRTGVFVAAYRLVFQGWTREAAIDEFRNGGYGYHARWYPNLVELLAKLDVDALRAKILAPDAAATVPLPVANVPTPAAQP